MSRGEAILVRGLAKTHIMEGVGYQSQGLGFKGDCRPSRSVSNSSLINAWVRSLLVISATKKQAEMAMMATSFCFCEIDLSAMAKLSVRRMRDKKSQVPR